MPQHGPLLERTQSRIHVSFTSARSCVVYALNKERRSKSLMMLHVSEGVDTTGRSYAVVTMVNHDDLKDGRAELFALTIRAIRERIRRSRIEVLVLDYLCRREENA